MGGWGVKLVKIDDLLINADCVLLIYGKVTTQFTAYLPKKDPKEILKSEKNVIAPRDRQRP